MFIGLAIPQFNADRPLFGSTFAAFAGLDISVAVLALIRRRPSMARGADV
jgi:hypothetical protein